MKTGAEIRQEFIDFFIKHDHKFVRSSPLIPLDDPTLLFANAGMNQFKDVFVGSGTRNYQRAVNSQKCLRASGKHNDLEDVGHDNFHHTFFEMLGNWSFGDYFKEKAIDLAWELLVGQWGIQKDKLYATVFDGDPQHNIPPDEDAERLWQKYLPAQRVLRCGKKDNFWEMGDSGPCGPCSELHLDLGEGTCPLSKQHQCAVNVDGCWRFVEVWNLVFIQYNRHLDGRLEPLPASHVDTGMGLERITRILQGKDSNYATDLFQPIINNLQSFAGQGMFDSAEATVSYRVIADHLRAISLTIADGVTPSNDGRGYVIRRMIRRSARYGRNLGIKQPFLDRLVDSVVSIMADAYPEVKERQEHIKLVLHNEESSFASTLERGIERCESLIGNLKASNKTTFPAVEAFKLYDTYGFPLDLTVNIAEENGLSVDQSEFEQHMSVQRELGRKDATKQAGGDWIIVNDGQNSDFIGYEHFECSANILRYQPTEQGCLMVFDQTVFYPEGGGQLADAGTITTKTDMGSQIWQVSDVQRDGDLIIHHCEGDKNVSATTVEMKIDAVYRRNIRRNHTAVHLLYAALREKWGDGITQAGSVVTDSYFRFDYTFSGRPEWSELMLVEQRVNEIIRDNIALNIYHTGYNQAIEKGVKAHFTEKYGDVVRVIKIDGFSEELCGGCHVIATGEIGVLVLTSEQSIAAGVRRVMGCTGQHAEALIRKAMLNVRGLRQDLQVNDDEIQEAVNQLGQSRRLLKKELDELKNKLLTVEADEYINDINDDGDLRWLARPVEGKNVEELRFLVTQICKKANDAVVLLYTAVDDKHFMVCGAGSASKVNAGKLIQNIAPQVDGRGGGRHNLATASLGSPQKLPGVLSNLSSFIKEVVA